MRAAVRWRGMTAPIQRLDLFARWCGAAARARPHRKGRGAPEHRAGPAAAGTAATLRGDSTATAQRARTMPEPTPGPTPEPFTKAILYTGADGRARFRDEAIALTQGTPQSILCALLPSGGMQLRRSPVGFRSQFPASP